MAHGLQCLRDGRACCPVVPKQLVICRFWRFQRRRHVVVSSFNVLLTGLIPVGLNVSLDVNHINMQGHVAIVHELLWYTGATLLAPVPAGCVEGFPSANIIFLLLLAAGRAVVTTFGSVNEVVKHGNFLNKLLK